MASPVLAIRIVADAAQAVGALGEVETKTSKLGQAMGKAKPYAAAALGGLAALGKGAFDLASQAQQSAGAVEAVFGAQAAGVKGYADQAAQNVGLAKGEYQDLAATIGSQLKNMGVSQEKLGAQTNDLVSLGADLSAQFGGSTSDAVAALSSLMRGETDPIERYGVSIKAADVAAQKAKMGLSGLTGAADKQATTQATLALLTQQTASAQGAFAREANTAAGQQQRASAEMANAGAKIGEALLPVVTQASLALATFGQWAQQNTPLVQGLAIAIGVIAAAVLAYNGITGAMAVVQGIATAAQWALNVAMSANPIGLVILAIVALIAIVVLLVTHWDTVKAVAIGVWEAIVGAVQAAWNWLVGIGQQIAQWAVKTWNAVLEANRRVWQAIVNFVKAVIQTQINIVKGFLNTVKGVWNNIVTAAKSAWNAVVNAHKAAINAAVNVVKGIISKVRSIFNQVKDAIRSALNGAVGIVSGIISRITATFDRIISRAREIVGMVSGIFSGIRLPSLPFSFAAMPPEVTLAYARTPGSVTAAATTPILDWPTLAGSRTTRPMVVVNITVNGALDPSSTARQVRDIINNDARTRGVVPLGGLALR